MQWGATPGQGELSEGLKLTNALGECSDARSVEVQVSQRLRVTNGIGNLGDAIVAKIQAFEILAILQEDSHALEVVVIPAKPIVVQLCHGSKYVFASFSELPRNKLPVGSVGEFLVAEEVPLAEGVRFCGWRPACLVWAEVDHLRPHIVLIHDIGEVAKHALKRCPATFMVWNDAVRLVRHQIHRSQRMTIPQVNELEAALE